jgi:hypothetical protein
VRALAVSSSERSSVLPDLPTIAEAGVPGFEHSTWFGLLAPAGTPTAIITRLNQTTVKALSQPELRKRLAQAGMEAKATTPQEFGSLIRTEIDKWAKVIAASGVAKQVVRRRVRVLVAAAGSARSWPPHASITEQMGGLACSGDAAAVRATLSGQGGRFLQALARCASQRNSPICSVLPQTLRAIGRRVGYVPAGVRGIFFWRRSFSTLPACCSSKSAFPLASA